MRRSMLCVLLLTGLGSCLHQYFFINEKRTWSDAQKFCRDKHTDLATVDDAEDMRELISTAGSSSAGEVWIGLNDDDLAWEWSLSDPRYYTAGDWMFRRWYNREPNNIRTQNMLCSTLLGEYWFDFFCNESFTFVCYNNSDNPALPANSNASYVHINKLMSWYDAQAYCRKFHTDLASVRNSTENTLVTQAVPYKLVWIGLYRFTWIWWSDNSTSPFRDWADGRPLGKSGNCAASVINATYLGKWVENPCTSKFSFMCHGKLKQLITLKLKVEKPTVDLNDPVVLESIRMFMEENLKAQAVTKGFTMSWIKRSDQTIFYKKQDPAGLINP